MNTSGGSCRAGYYAGTSGGEDTLNRHTAVQYLGQIRSPEQHSGKCLSESDLFGCFCLYKNGIFLKLMELQREWLLQGALCGLGQAVSLRYHSGDSRRLDTDRVTRSVTGLPNLGFLSCGIFAATVVVHENEEFRQIRIYRTPSTRMRTRDSVDQPLARIYNRAMAEPLWPRKSVHASS